MSILLIIVGFWLACLLLLWAWKGDLFRKTWYEPYFKEAIVLIESDDWGRVVSSMPNDFAVYWGTCPATRIPWEGRPS